MYGMNHYCDIQIQAFACNWLEIILFIEFNVFKVE
jgi:hypothetical protein